MNIWIDIEDASGQRYGDGPITTATEWRSTRRLDRAGVFSFRMPAADPRAQYLAHKRIVRCWTADEHGLRELGAGIVERIELRKAAGEPAMLTVAGDDLLRELARVSVGDLALYDVVSTSPDEIYLDPPGPSISLPAVINFNPSPRVFLRVEHTDQWSSMTFALSGGNTVVGALSVQYQESTTEAWVQLPLSSDTTTVDGRPFAQSGTITFNPPARWMRNDDGRYAIRFSAPEDDLDQFTLSALSLNWAEPIDDALARIMTLAPTGWSLDPSGQIATDSTVYMVLSGESVLTALVKLAEQTGEHFILAPIGRRVRWLGPVETAEQIAAMSSGLRAIAASQPSADTMALIDLSQTSDSYDLYTRAYGYGGGVGSGRLTLANTTRSVTGYVLNRTASYLERTAAIACYGRIDAIDSYPDLAPVDASEAQIIQAANALYDRVYQRLRRRSELQYAYDMSVIPGQYPLYPGQTIRVTYDEWVDGYHAVAIDRDLWVLEITQQIGEDGVMVVDPLVATVDVWPENDSRALTKTMGEVEDQRSVELPTNGYTSTESGVPTSIDIRDGSVIGMSRVIPIEDGLYPADWRTQDLKAIRVRNGIVVGVELDDI